MERLPVSESKQIELKSRMDRLGIREADLEEQFVRGAGAGGQKINKTSGTVLLKYLPLGMIIRCQKSRSQALNRYWARRLLVEKVEERVFKEKSEKQQKIEKIRRQKRKRSRRAKEKMLQEKQFQSKKKGMRKVQKKELFE
jgi:protein subunit release factor B